MIFSWLLREPLLAILWLVAIVLSLTVHEFSHALSAKWLGDQTAERDGRLTLNPLAHLDLVGFFAMMFLGFGWAKPVPYNPYNLRAPVRDGVVIGLAGPFANILLAFVSALTLRSLAPAATETLLTPFLLFLLILNLSLALFNLIPIHPLDGSKILLALTSHPRHAHLHTWLLTRGPQILFLLIFLSLLTPLNPFQFLSRWVFSLCGVLVGDACFFG
ncbi:site-2 protease family protein [Candidatus Uhrbacteria bacterium]|nr:site-2 protease family protein [Candidatus Uhrbacteria bacterium]